MPASRVHAMSDPIGDAAAAALTGRLIVIPTDTVYRIGTRADDPAATGALFDAKGRPRDVAIALLVPPRHTVAGTGPGAAVRPAPGPRFEAKGRPRHRAAPAYGPPPPQLTSS